MIKAIHALIDTFYADMVQARRYLHMHPELSFHEEQTAQYIVDFYEDLGLPYERDIGGHGVIARLTGGQPGKTIAFRADFDALPIQDEKESAYRSRVPDVMHACGHDGHTTALLFFAKAMQAFQADLPGTLVFVHQHAEEMAPGGAKSLIDSGLLDDIDAIFGAHLWVTVPLGEVQSSRQALMAGADRFDIDIQGQGGHGASPHETKDAVLIAAELVSQLQTIVSRRIDPLETAVVTVGSMQAGHAFNIIADTAQLTGTVRYLNPAIQTQIKSEMQRMIDGVCLSYDATATFAYAKGYPPLINDPEAAELVLQAAKKVDDLTSAYEVVPTMGAEDFTYYLQAKPGAFFFAGAQQAGNPYPHHHPKFDFDERVMPQIAKIFSQIVLDYQVK